MNPSLPYVDLVFCLKFPILNLTQRLLEEGKCFSIIMSSKAFHSMGCMQDMWPCCKIGWRQLHFSWAYPLTGRDSTGKESKHIKIFAINVVGGRRTGYRSHTRSAERLEEPEENVWSVG